jgi:G:T-mismatch repair DNA endonuclease (very short patch repair protein)
MSRPWTTEQFIERAKQVEKHKDKYDYSKVKYINSQTKITIICRLCSSEFQQVPNSHLQGYGCDICAHVKNHKGQTLTKEQMVEKAVAVHGADRYDYTDSDYKLSRLKINIKCNECEKTFAQTPNNHISKGFGCPSCAGNAPLTTSEFVEKARRKHHDLYDYSLTKYERSNKNVLIKCRKTGKVFQQLPNNHLREARCPCCHPKYSRPSSEYMMYRAVSNPSIVYGDAEHKIVGGRRYKADGYIPETNHVLEFHGCIFHGCPRCRSPMDINPITKEINAELLAKTQQKKQFIIDQGYKYSEIWGCEWTRAIQSVKILQAIWRKTRGATITLVD